MINKGSVAWCVVGDFNAMRYPFERQCIGHSRANW